MRPATAALQLGILDTQQVPTAPHRGGVVGDEPRDLVPQPALDDSLKLLHHVLGSAVVLLGCDEVQEAGHAERACCVAQEVMGALGARPTVKRHLQVDGFRHLAVHLQLGLDVAGEQQTASQLR